MTTDPRKLSEIGWRSWLILFTCFYMNALFDGFVLSFGMLMVEMEKDYPQISEAWIAVIGALVPGLYCALSPVSTLLIRRPLSIRSACLIGTTLQTLGYFLAFLNYEWKLGFVFDFMTLGVLQGVGTALLYTPLFIIADRHFYDHLGLATGILTCGSPFGAIIFGFFFNPMLNATPYGWRGIILFLTCLTAVTIFLSLFFSDPTRKHRSNDHERERLISEDKLITEDVVVASKPKKSKLWTQALWIVIFMTSWSNMGYYVPTLLITDQADKPQYGVSSFVRNNLIFLWGLAHLVSRVVSGRLSDLGRHRLLLTSFSLYLIGLLVSAAAVVVFPFVMMYGDVAFVSFALIYGIFSAPFIGLEPKIVKDIVEEDVYDMALAIMFATNSFVIILGFALSAWINALAPLYAYLGTAACFLFSALTLLTMTSKFFETRRRRQTPSESENYSSFGCRPTCYKAI